MFTYISSNHPVDEQYKAMVSGYKAPKNILVKFGVTPLQMWREVIPRGNLNECA